MHHGTCVAHLSRSLTRSGGENITGIPGAYATDNSSYLTRGPIGIYPKYICICNLAMRLVYPTFRACTSRSLIGTDTLIKRLSNFNSGMYVIDANALGNKHAKCKLYNAWDQTVKQKSVYYVSVWQPVISWIIEWVRKYIRNMSASNC